MSGHYSHWLHYTGDRLSGFERLRVDAAQTSFFEGREFRAFQELSIAAGATLVIKAVVPINIILSSAKLTLTDGWVRMATMAGGTEGGTFTPITVFGKNNMTSRRKTYGAGDEYYTSALSVSQGGTQSGGTLLDVLLVRTSSATAQAASVADSATSRGVLAGTYYFRVQNLGSGTATGVLSFEWEERP